MIRSGFLKVVVLGLLTTANPALADRYGEIVREDGPVAWWRFGASENGVVKNAVSQEFAAHSVGSPKWTQDGPRPSDYPDFDTSNKAIGLPFGKNYFVVKDPGKESPLDFTVGDSITIEAWIKIDSPLRGSFPYIVGKGRTHNPGTNHNNQNYSLRLATAGGASKLSFFFVDETGGSTSIEAAGHRWTSKESVPQDGFWHHVALTYTFGEADSLKGYLDGELISGVWDMAGKTKLGPINDNDELWIGSAMGGGATLGAGLDELAIYRRSLSKDEIAAHANIDITYDYFAFEETSTEAPTDHVRVEILEGLSQGRSWKFLNGETELLYQTDVFALKNLPNKYDNKGLIIDRAIPSLIHLSSLIELEGGEYEFILRSLDASRLYINGELIAKTGLLNLQSDAHQDYYRLPDFGDDLLSIPAGHQEQRVTVSLAPGKHAVSLYRLVGNKGKGDYLGEMVVGIAEKGKQFHFLSPSVEREFTDEGWLAFLEEERLRLREWNQKRRLANSRDEQQYWRERHQWAKQHAGPAVEVPQVQNEKLVHNEIDRFILASLENSGQNPTDLISDWAFLRRVYLDVIGVIPTGPEIEQYFQDLPEVRRELAIDRLLEHPGWADHWTTYWQDVLAENPGLTKPELNNSGPFRWYLYESFLDNKPFDRFATELALMEGSAYSGGPAGFGIASQNDVPMAAKAHIMGTAFLAVEMKCARCHDAPYHDVRQEDLFSFAALLKRGPQKVPGSSTIPLSEEDLNKLAVKVTLKPGSDVRPNWPFAEFVAGSKEHPPEIPDFVLRKPNDTRHQLAAMMTIPQNERFTNVIVNRIWARLMGRGIVHPVDDWEEAEPSHPELLSYLSRDFVLNGYDIKKTMRLILNSRLYQQQAAVGMTADSLDAGNFTGPVRRKLTGEQLADSLYRATGKSFGAEELTMDADGKQPDSRFGHLGIPQRGWQLVAVSNERDRPSMSLPVAQSVIDLMAAYGWRTQRQDPLTHREDPLTALQPMALANGTSALRAIDFSDESTLTQLALTDRSVEEFVDELFELLLTRPATSDEREMLADMLREGYAERVVAGPEAVPPKRIFRSGVTWINHFHPEADNEAIARGREILKGDTKSARLNPDWRRRAEDVTWALVNTPEFVFIP